MSPRVNIAGHSFPRRLRAYGSDARGAAVVEFALVMPVLILILLAGFEIAQALSIDRKLVDTTAELASLVSQQSTLTTGQAQALMTDTSQIMAPYTTANLSITISEVTTSSSCNSTSCPTTYNWVQSQSGGVAGANGTVTSGTTPFTQLPKSLWVASTSYLLVQTSYTYRPTVGSHYVSTIPISSQLYISPRQVSTISCGSC